VQRPASPAAAAAASAAARAAATAVDSLSPAAAAARAEAASPAPAPPRLAERRNAASRTGAQGTSRAAAADYVLRSLPRAADAAALICARSPHRSPHSVPRPAAAAAAAPGRRAAPLAPQVVLERLPPRPACTKHKLPR